MNNVDCPQCGAALKAPEELSAKKVRCPKCGTVFAAPSVKEDAPIAVEEAGNDDHEPPVLEESNALPHSENASTSTRRPETLPPSSTGHNFASGFVYCRECGKQISRKAIACPVCGAPAEAANTPARRPTADPARRSPLLEKMRVESAQLIESAKTPNYVLTGAAFAVLVGAFLPWIGNQLVSLNALNIIQVLWMSREYGNSTPIPDIFPAIFYFHYILPIVAVAIMALEIVVLKRKARFAKTVTALAFLLLLISLQYLFFLVFGGATENMWRYLGFGYWLTLAGALTAVVADAVKAGFRGLSVACIFAILVYYGILFEEANSTKAKTGEQPLDPTVLSQKASSDFPTIESKSHMTINQAMGFVRQGNISSAEAKIQEASSLLQSLRGLVGGNADLQRKVSDVERRLEDVRHDVLLEKRRRG